MATVTVELPEELLSDLRKSPEEFAREMRLAAAIHWYGRGEISQGKAAQIAGMNRIAFLKILAQKQINVVNVDLDDLRKELGRG